MATYFLHTGVLDALRVRRGLSLQVLAAKGQLSMFAIRKMCLGEREYVDGLTARRLAKALDVDVSLLCDINDAELAGKR